MTKKKRIYYKVISSKDGYRGPRRSAIVTPKGGGIYYSKRQWIKPKIKGSKLMVFKRKKDAIEFKKTIYYAIIVRCYIKGLKSNNLFMTLNPEQCRDFWKKANKLSIKKLKELCADNTSPIYTPPEGTVYASAVYCLE